jgi:hypothetical protein
MENINNINIDRERLLAEVTEKMSENPLLWGYYFFPNHFRDNPPPFHLDITRAILNNRHVTIAAPRESAKSTIVAFLYVFHAIVFKRKRFIVIVGNTESKAKEHLDAIKRELHDNIFLKAALPKLKLVKDSEIDTIFRHQDAFETRVLCKGTEQIPKIRGVKFNAYRPDLIICDDLEDDEMVRSKERRFKLKEDFDTALIPAGDRKKCQYIIIGTVLHDDSQLAKLLNHDLYPEFKTLFYQALDEQTDESLWPEKWSVQDLYKMRDDKPLTFAKEMQNDPVSGQNQRFQRSDFRYWRVDSGIYELLDTDNSVIKRGFLANCKGAIACDLAWSERKDADNSVVLGGYLTPDNEILINEYVAEKGLRPDRLATILFEMAKRLQSVTESVVPIGFEKAILEKVAKWNLRQEMKKRNEYLLIKELKWEHDKITRIELILQPRYANHSIYHRTNMGELEHELERFPYGVHDDIIDALQGVCQLLKNPKKAKQTQKKDDAFEFWRNLARKQNQRDRKRYVFGKKNKKFEVPATVTFR